MPLFSRNVELAQPLRLSSWRKVAIGTWRSAGDPSVYGVLEVPAAAALQYLESIHARTGVKATMTHFAARAIAECMGRHPEVNCILRFGRLFPRSQVDVFVQVAADTVGKDLSGMTIRQANTKKVSEIARELQESARVIREKGDPSFKRMKSTMGLLPGFLSGLVLTLSGWLMYTLNLWTPLLGTPRDPFGGAMLTSIGSLGLDMAFAPLVPYSRVPLVIAVGAVREVAVSRGGRIVSERVLSLCVTFDHRLIDGVHASRMAKTMQHIFADPEHELGAG